MAWFNERNDPIYLKNEKNDWKEKIAQLEYKQHNAAFNGHPLSFDDQASLTQYKKNLKEVYADIERVEKKPEPKPQPVQYRYWDDPKAYGSKYNDYDSDD